MKTAMAMATCVVLAFVQDANAGEAGSVSVFVSGTTASGSMTGARYSGDDNQYIGCIVDVYGTSSPVGMCYGNDAHNASAACYTTNPAYVSLIGALNSTSYISFGATNGICTALIIESFSWNLR